MRNDGGWAIPAWGERSDDPLVTIGPPPPDADWPDVSDDDTDAPLDPPSAEEKLEQ